MEILIKRLNDQAKLPAYSSEAGPGIDLYSLNEVVVEPGAKVVVSTGVAMAIPVGYVGLVWSRNSFSITDPIKVSDSMVVSGYRDEISVEIENKGSEAVTFTAGEKVAQLMVQKIHKMQLIEAADLSGGPEED
ncbi:hypothetical protein H6784_03035 [Candidatus Nomurabacteria bacterium]|nr:hypothetical protein [Candidatus Kaiserbacteria bacterium]MCB9814368.1 hypothetical protein [Candidatus Nomurabacteria bacterium]